MSNIIQLSGISKSYQIGKGTITVLDDISLEIGAGEFVSIMGPSGGGKTTLLNIMGLLDSPTTGTVRIHGKDVWKRPKSVLVDVRRRTIGYVFQQFHLIPTLNAAENIALPLVFAKEKINSRVDELLELVGLSHRAGYKPGQLSGGEQQRVAIARALVLKPDIILADEPTGALDRKSGAKILSLLQSFSENVTVVMVTHNQSLTSGSDTIINLEDGKILGVT